MAPNKILDQLPYSHPFLFVEALEEVNENGCKGTYTFPEDAFYYEGHFKDYPVTPGVILTECMAQIGVVTLGIYLLRNEPIENARVSMSSSSVDFYLPVYPGEKVTVSSEKLYFRLNKLKCGVRMTNREGKLICKGEISGMLSNG